jgi:hypothetical protein
MAEHAEVVVPTTEEIEQMHDTYRRGGMKRQMAPQCVYSGPTCPHPGCSEPMQTLDFRLEDDGRTVHDTLVRAWWNDTGFVGKCPRCGGWIHFTIRTKSAIAPEVAAKYPQLPDEWHSSATIL